MNPAEFAAKWTGSTRSERAAAQEHFIDLCRMLGVPTPNEADPTGETYAFEKGAEKTGGGDGYADVWKRGHFGWEQGEAEGSCRWLRGSEIGLGRRRGFPRFCPVRPNLDAPRRPAHRDLRQPGSDDSEVRRLGSVV